MPSTINFSRKSKGFTLAELLISLAILGIIATFTIPKILLAQQGQKYNAAAKEVASMASGAYQQLQLKGSVITVTNATDLSPYLNYISLDTVSAIDDMPGGTTNSCASQGICLNLHNGGKVLLWNSYFAGTTNNAIMVQFDPDGVVTDGTTNGPGKSVKFALYYNGFITTRANVTPGTTNSIGTYNPNPASDPSWFSW